MPARIYSHATGSAGPIHRKDMHRHVPADCAIFLGSQFTTADRGCFRICSAG